MAPLPPSNTARYKVLYTNVSEQHSMMVRSTPVSPSAFGTAIQAFFTALGGIIYPSVIDEIQFAASGSDIFNAVATGAEGFTFGAGTPDDSRAADFVGFVGRTSGGRRARLFVFGVDSNQAHDYRYGSGESTAVDNTIPLLNGTTGVYLGIDGLAPVWKSYANVGVNAHWQKALRP